MTTQDTWLSGKVIGISISESEDLLGYGVGRAHLRELLVRLARRLLRAGANLAYGGHFEKDSFTRDLIELISEEQREGSTDQRPWIGMLYNHSPWPLFEVITDEDEASFVDACRFVRITQEDAGIPEDARLVSAHERGDDLHTLFNKAAVLTAMRRAMATGMTLHDTDAYQETIPPVSCRVFVAGKTSNFTGVLPGLFEEMLYCFEEQKPIFILGGFGGASARLADYLSGNLTAKEACLDLDTLREAAPNLVKIESGFNTFARPPEMQTPAEALEQLVRHLDMAKKSFRQLRNGLTKEENLRLFTTVDTAEAAELVIRGLRKAMAAAPGGS